MYSIFFTTHKIVVTLFLLIYLVKTILLLSNNADKLAKFTKAFKIPEMIISFLFLITGGYMLMQLPSINMLMIIKLVAVFASIPLAVIGFKKSNKLLAVLSLVLIIGAYGLAEMSKKKSATADVPANTVSGKEIYSAYCSRCHGEDGKLGAMGAVDLSTSKLDESISSQIVIAGKGAMPGFNGQLSVEQADAVAEYIQSLKQ